MQKILMMQACLLHACMRTCGHIRIVDLTVHYVGGLVLLFLRCDLIRQSKTNTFHFFLETNSHTSNNMNEENVIHSMPMAVKTMLDQSGTSTSMNAIDIEVTPASTPHRPHDADHTSPPDSVKLPNPPGEKPMREFPPVPEPLEIFKTNDTLADMSSDVEDEEHVELEDVVSIFQVPVATGIAVFDDQISSLHDDDRFVPEHPERPGRIALVKTTLMNLGLYECCLVIPTRHAKVEELMAVHSRSYIS